MLSFDPSDVDQTQPASSTTPAKPLTFDVSDVDAPAKGAAPKPMAFDVSDVDTPAAEAAPQTPPAPPAQGSLSLGEADQSQPFANAGFGTPQPQQPPQSATPGFSTAP